MALFAFALYILPGLIWNFGYDIPQFIFDWREALKENYNFTDRGAAAALFLLFFIPALVLGYLSSRLANRMDNKLLNGDQPEVDEQEEMKLASQKKLEVQDSVSFGMKVFMLIVLVFIALAFVEWLIAVPAPI